MKTFVLTRHEQLDMIVKFLKALPFDGKWKVEIKRNSGKRSMAQKGLLWLWYTDIGAELGYRKDEIHDLLRFQLLEPDRKEIMGKVVENLPSTEKMSVVEMTEYLNAIEMWAADIGIRLRHPEDLYMEAVHGVKAKGSLCDAEAKTD